MQQKDHSTTKKMSFSFLQNRKELLKMAGKLRPAWAHLVIFKGKTSLQKAFFIDSGKQYFFFTEIFIFHWTYLWWTPSTVPMDHLCDLHRHYLTECLVNQKMGRLSCISLWWQNQTKPTKTKNLRKDTQYENYSFVLRVQFIGIRTLWYYTLSSLHLQPFTSSQSITILISVSSSGSPALPPAPAHSTCPSTHHLLSVSESRCCHYCGLSTPGHFCLGGFNVHYILKAHPHQDSVKFPSGLNNIPLYVYIYHISPRLCYLSADPPSSDPSHLPGLSPSS